MKCVLQEVGDRGSAKRFEFDREEISIGRTAGNDLVLNDQSVSRSHAKCVQRGGVFHIVDLGSRNGVRLNGEAVQDAPLKDGDRIEIGEFPLLFHCPELAGDTTVVTRVKVEKAGGKGLPRVVGSLFKGLRGKEGGGTPSAKTGRASYLALLKKPVVFAPLGLLLVLLLLLALPEGKKPEPQYADNSRVAVPLPAEGYHGNMAQDRTRVDLATFSFTVEGKARALLGYEIGGASSGEVELFLNSQPLGPAPPSGQWFAVKKLRLPGELLRQGENLLVFDNVKNSPEHAGTLRAEAQSWGVRDVSVALEPFPPCDPAAAAEHFHRAGVKYKELKISPRNLYDAVGNYREAIDLAELCDEPPSFLAQARADLARAAGELEEGYHARIFAATQAYSLQDLGRVKRELEEIRKVFPDPDDFHYRKAEYLLEKFNL